MKSVIRDSRTLARALSEAGAVGARGLATTVLSPKLEVITVVPRNTSEIAQEVGVGRVKEKELASLIRDRIDSGKLAGTFKAVPERSDLPADINENLIVELYSK